MSFHFLINRRYLRTSDTAHIPSRHVSNGFGIHCSIASTFCQSPEIQLSSTHCHAVSCTRMNRRNTLSKTEKLQGTRFELNSFCLLYYFFYTLPTLCARGCTQNLSVGAQFYGHFNSLSVDQCYVLREFEATLLLSVLCFIGYRKSPFFSQCSVLRVSNATIPLSSVLCFIYI